MKKTLMVVLAFVTLLIGLFIGQMLPPNKEQVRKALYVACVNGTGYSANSDGTFGCNRRSIDYALANVYGDSYMPPLPDAAARAKFEEPLLKLKRR